MIDLPEPRTIATAASAAMHPDERRARTELAACYRVFALLGWTELIFNHITLRLPASVAGTANQFLINPFGLHYNEVTASNLVKIDVAGKVIGQSQYPVNPAGFLIHSALHQSLPDAHCVMHTHTTAGVAVASVEGGLLQSNFYTAQLHDKIAYHDFEGITLHTEEAPRLIASLGDKQALILRNHGLLVWGTSIAQAFVLLWTLQRACEIQLATMSMGRPIVVTDPIAERSTIDALQFKSGSGGAIDVFNAMVRQVDRAGRDYDDLT